MTSRGPLSSPGAPGSTMRRMPVLGGWETGVFALIPCPLLRGAAERLAATHREEPTETLGEGVARDAVIVLTRAIYDQRSGRASTLPTAAAAPVSLRVLDGLRT